MNDLIFNGLKALHNLYQLPECPKLAMGKPSIKPKDRGVLMGVDYFDLGSWFVSNSDPKIDSSQNKNHYPA